MCRPDNANTCCNKTTNMRTTTAADPVKSGPKKTTTSEYALNFAFFSFVGFTVFQFLFALVAHSQSLLTDCAAMSVDAATYLINLFAEKMKNRPLTEQEIALPPEVRIRQRKLVTLYLELIPPLISVATLLGVTILALKESFQTLGSGNTAAAAPDLTIMLAFSGLNLILDVISVSCFSQASKEDGGEGGGGLFQLPEPTSSSSSTTETTTIENERTSLLAQDIEQQQPQEDSGKKGLNLNMCSAFTHVCADTLRSVAVLTAAGFSTLFPQVLSASAADSWGAIIVSFIIIISLVPLIQGLYFTAMDIYNMLVEDRQQKETTITHSVINV